MSTRRSIRYSKTPVHTASKSGTETYLNTVLMCEQKPYKCDRNVRAIRHSEGINCEQYLFSLSSQDLVHLAGLKLRTSREGNSFTRTYKYTRRARDSPVGVLAVYRKLYSEDKRVGKKNKQTKKALLQPWSLNRHLYVYKTSILRKRYLHLEFKKTFQQFWWVNILFSNERNLLKNKL